MKSTLLILFALTMLGQTPQQTQTPPAQTPPANPNAPEMATHDEATAFKSRVNLVMVPVVVRDLQGRAVGQFTREDFHLFDKGKPQEITKFSVEKAGELMSGEGDSPGAAAATKGA